jgi:hypothetical protein
MTFKAQHWTLGSECERYFCVVLTPHPRLAEAIEALPSPASRRGKERLLRRRGQRVDRHFGTRIRDREPAVLLGAKCAPAL